ncbi:hypothetical protein LB526_18735 [Mesorhizobium sp. CA6]|uniref:hypothetical protein n=1 Tax=Mesorhizobium sp. CA6 TaxID=588500 RepID=UPI001CCBFBDB|nr:hypothetical protein [Mesorhizobium sp. CA6]MBZ9768798.1 hypothetical protein [Mesorhizobium sp. CA6]
MSPRRPTAVYQDKNSPSDQSKPEHDVEMELQTAILLTLRDYRRRSIVSTNHVITTVRQLCPGCILPDQALAALIQEAAILLALIPVFDPCLGKTG